MVNALPELDAIISAIKYGNGCRFVPLQIAITTGVKRSTTASFTKNALEIPVTKMIRSKSCFGVFARVIVVSEMRRKNPSISNTAISIIIPNNKAIVLKSMAEIDSSNDRMPKTIIETAPKKAALGLSIFKPGKRVKIIPA